MSALCTCVAVYVCGGEQHVHIMPRFCQFPHCCVPVSVLSPHCVQSQITSRSLLTLCSPHSTPPHNLLSGSCQQQQPTTAGESLMPASTRSNKKRTALASSSNAPTPTDNMAASSATGSSGPSSSLSAFSSLSFLELFKGEYGLGDGQVDDIFTNHTLRQPNRQYGTDDDLQSTAFDHCRSFIHSVVSIDSTAWQRSTSMEKKIADELQQTKQETADITTRTFVSPPPTSASSSLDGSSVLVLLHGSTDGWGSHFVVCRESEYVMLGCRSGHPYIAAPSVSWDNSDGSGPELTLIKGKRRKREGKEENDNEAEEEEEEEDEEEELPSDVEDDSEHVDADDVGVLLDVMKRWFEAFTANEYH